MVSLYPSFPVNGLATKSGCHTEFKQQVSGGFEQEKAGMVRGAKNISDKDGKYSLKSSLKTRKMRK